MSSPDEFSRPPSWASGASAHTVNAKRARNAEPSDEEARRRVYEQYLLGLNAARLQAAVADIQDVRAVCRHIIDVCERDARDAMTSILEADNLSDEQVAAAHFKGRVAGAILAKLNTMIREGDSAAEQIAEEQEQ